MALWFIKRQRPILMAEDPEFIEILKYLNPSSNPVKADSIKNTIMSQYEEGKSLMKVLRI